MTISEEQLLYQVRRLLSVSSYDPLRDIREGVELMGYDYVCDSERMEGGDTILEFRSPTHPALEVRVKGG